MPTTTSSATADESSLHVFDTATVDLVAFAQLLTEIDLVTLPTVGVLITTRLSQMWNLLGAVFLLPQGRSVYIQPNTPYSDKIQALMLQFAHAIFVAPPTAIRQSFLDKFLTPKIMLRSWPIWYERQVQAVLCIGTKRNGNEYTSEEEAIQNILVHHIALRLANLELQRDTRYNPREPW